MLLMLPPLRGLGTYLKVSTSISLVQLKLGETCNIVQLNCLQMIIGMIMRPF
ncbi:hypothetical protein V6Z11_A10G079800 [Gossypium hirsutum]